jgi:hypothetical protein
MKSTHTPLRLCNPAEQNSSPKEPSGKGAHSIEQAASLRNLSDDLAMADDLEQYDRLGVIRGILWGMAVVIPFWAILRWVLATP